MGSKEFQLRGSDWRIYIVAYATELMELPKKRRNDYVLLTNAKPESVIEIKDISDNELVKVKIDRKSNNVSKKTLLTFVQRVALLYLIFQQERKGKINGEGNLLL